MWFPATIETAAYYRVPLIFRLKGRLNVEAFQSAFRQLVLRNEILRTRYHLDGDDVWQEVLASVPADIQPCDPIEKLDDPKELRDVVHSFWRGEQPTFDDGVNFKARLARVSSEEHLFFAWINHIAADGPSIGHIQREQAALYLVATGAAPAPVPHRLQYADYAIWQNASPARDTDRRRRWREDLRQAPILELITADMQPQKLSANTLVFIPPEAVRALGATPAIVLLAGIGSALFAVTRRSRFTMGLLVNSRPTGAHGMIGCFTRLRPLRFDFTGSPTAEELIARMLSSYTEVLDPKLEDDEIEPVKGLGSLRINILRQSGAMAVSAGDLTIERWGALGGVQGRFQGELMIDVIESCGIHAISWTSSTQHLTRDDLQRCDRELRSFLEQLGCATPELGLGRAPPPNAVRAAPPPL